jgi:hypothetical protein
LLVFGCERLFKDPFRGLLVAWEKSMLFAMWLFISVLGRYRTLFFKHVAWSVFALNAQVTRDSSEIVAQKRKKRRSQSDKVGRLKYNQQLLKRVLAGIEEVRDMQRVILNGLKGAGYFSFDVPMLQRTACVDRVDLEILQRVHEVGVQGVFPKDVAGWVNKLGDFGLRYYDVSRRIVRMNRRLERETGELLFEKRGHRWALTAFAFRVWGETEKEVR